jgi:hypothetical protein
LQSKASTVGSLGVIMVNGIAEVQPHVPFGVRVINLSAEQRLLKNGMVLGFSLPHPTMVFTIPDNAGQPTAPEIKTDLAHTDDMADDPGEKKLHWVSSVIGTGTKYSAY